MGTSQMFQTDRLLTHAYVAGDPAHPPLVLLHGNTSSSDFFDRLIGRLSEHRCVVAPDLRGYGRSETKPVDATRGLSDFADDIAALLRCEAVGIGGRPVDFVGWSVGASVGVQIAIDHPGVLGHLVLLNPASPYGFGGTSGLRGTPSYDDFAGSGGGTANPEFVALLQSKERGTESPTAPRNVMKQFFWHAGFEVEPEREERYLDAVLSTVVGPGNYPGDQVASPNWPGVAPGTRGMNNALSPKYMNQAPFAAVDPKPPVLWIRGNDDMIVSDSSMFDFAVLGELGAVPGWPGAEVYPAQPMVSQMRSVLEAYAQGGGRFREVVMKDCGHSPHLEHEDETVALIEAFLG